jgi:hypothetical protein
MKWYFAEQDVSVAIDYVVDDQYVVPSSASFMVRTADGSELISGSLPSLSTTESLLIQDIYNELSAGNDFEQRFVIVFFVYNGQTYHTSLAYGITTFIPMSSTPQDVRRELGVDRSELLDDEIDVYQAYFSLAALHGSSFTEAFTAGGTRSLSANRAVSLQAALDVIESMPLRAFQMMRSEHAETRRFRDVDFKELADSLRAKLAAELEILKEVTPIAPTIFELSFPTDPITNT